MTQAEEAAKPVAPDGARERLLSRVADYLGQHGYTITRDVSVTGRSGTGYHLDLVAERSDEVATYRVLFEAKAWSSPVESDLVAGVHLAVGDLGLSKGIVLTREGWKAGVDETARKLGVDLWGPGELQSRLGPAQDSAPRPTKEATVGLPVVMGKEVAADLARRASRGALRVGREEIAWVRPFWLPFHRIRVRHTSEERQRLRKAQLRTQEFWNVYDGLSGSLYAQWDDAPELPPTKGGNVVPPRLPSVRIVNDIEAVARSYNEEEDPEAVERQEEALVAYGIELPVSFFDLSPEGELYIPFYLALLRRQGGERVVAIDANQQRPSEEMSRVALMHLGYILETASSRQP